MTTLTSSPPQMLRLKPLQQAVSRKPDTRSRNRRKAVFALAREQVRIANRRRDFLHQQSARLVARCALIVTGQELAKVESGGRFAVLSHETPAILA